MDAKEKAKELVEKYKELQITILGCGDGNPCIIKNTMIYNSAKQCALIACENEYKSNRELLFSLRSSKVIESEKVYLIRLQGLINEEQEVKNEIERL
jgi:hypothetical protein